MGEQISNPIIFKKFIPEIKNVLILGAIGQGKSTLLNKITYYLNTKKLTEIEEGDFKKASKKFKAKKSLESVTLNVQIETYPEYGIKLIDTQGFCDPNPNNMQRDLWIKLLKQIHVDVDG
jgi:septin family protein